MSKRNPTKGQRIAKREAAKALKREEAQAEREKQLEVERSGKPGQRDTPPTTPAMPERPRVDVRSLDVASTKAYLEHLGIGKTTVEGAIQSPLALREPDGKQIDPAVVALIAHDRAEVARKREEYLSTLPPINARTAPREQVVENLRAMGIGLDDPAILSGFRDPPPPQDKAGDWPGEGGGEAERRREMQRARLKVGDMIAAAGRAGVVDVRKLSRAEWQAYQELKGLAVQSAHVAVRRGS